MMTLLSLSGTRVERLIFFMLARGDLEFRLKLLAVLGLGNVDCNPFKNGAGRVIDGLGHQLFPAMMSNARGTSFPSMTTFGEYMK